MVVTMPPFFSTKMAAVTSLIMLTRSQNRNNHTYKPKFIKHCMFHGYGFIIFGSMTTLSTSIIFFIFLTCDRYFNGRLGVNCTKYAYNRNQRVQIIRNRHFVFGFTSFQVLTVFQLSVWIEIKTFYSQKQSRNLMMMFILLEIRYKL